MRKERPEKFTKDDINLVVQVEVYDNDELNHSITAEIVEFNIDNGENHPLRVKDINSGSGFILKDDGTWKNESSNLFIEITKIYPEDNYPEYYL